MRRSLAVALSISSVLMALQGITFAQTPTTTTVSATTSGAYVTVYISTSGLSGCPNEDASPYYAQVGTLSSLNFDMGSTSDVLTLGPFGPGNYPVTGYFSGYNSYLQNGDSCSVAASQGTTTVTVGGPQASAITLTPPSAPIREGQSVPVTVTVEGANDYDDGPNPTGTVVLFYKSFVLATGTLSPNADSYPISSGSKFSLSSKGIAPGTYTLDAVYNGDSNLTGSNAQSVTVTISPTLLPTTTALTVSPEMLAVGQSATLTATVTPSVSGTTPTGTVTFLYGNVVVASGALNSSGVDTARVSAAGIPLGVYGLTARYSGDQYNASSTSSSANVTIAANTTTTVSANRMTVTPGQAVVFTAKVARTGASGVPDGTVSFLFDGYALGAGTLNGSGTASFTFSTNGLSAGSYPITARYNGDTLDYSSTSSPITLTVQ